MSRFVFYIKKKTNPGNQQAQTSPEVRCCHKFSNWNKRVLSRSAVLTTLLATSKPKLKICTFWSWMLPRHIIVGAGFQAMDFIANPWNSEGLRFHVLVWRTTVTYSRFYNCAILTKSKEANSFLKVTINFYVRKSLSPGIFVKAECWELWNFSSVSEGILLSVFDLNLSFPACKMMVIKYTVDKATGVSADPFADTSVWFMKLYWMIGRCGYQK